MKYNSKTYKLTDIGNFGQYSLITGILFLLLSGIGYFQDSTHFFLAYLTSFVFWISISLGGLFFTMLHHITGAKWSIVIRRISECVTGTLPLMAVLFIPLAFGMHELYHWSHADIVVTDELLQEKSPYLNTAFFLIRTAGYFVIWILLSQSLIKTSLKQDNGHKESQLKKMRRVSAPGMVLFMTVVLFERSFN
ncbi:MAG: hypothetical protein ACE5D6_00695, partial [Candidatus Zixiibacteriota bacterium]